MKRNKITGIALMALAMISVASCGDSNSSEAISKDIGESSNSVESSKNDIVSSSSASSSIGSSSSSSSISSSSSSKESSSSSSASSSISSTTVSSSKITETANQVKVLEASGNLESCIIKWQEYSGASKYNVYYKKASDSSFKLAHQSLTRKYSEFYRADIVGLSAGSYEVKVIPVIDNNEDLSKASNNHNVTVKAHDRSGFGFVKGTGATTKVTTNTSSGAYNDDGSLKDNAIVVYIANSNKDSATATINGVSCVGLQNIIAGAKKQNTPVCIRLIGNITDPSVLEKGDLLIDAITCGITIEGIGDDTTINGFGIRIKNSSNVEIRNLAFMNCNSGEGDNVGIQQGADHVWIHNCDMFYGDAGSDEDQVKGDGALDTKKSSYITHSYNHFWDNGKCNLQGMKDEETTNYITYHHNWYDHSDSRHPRIRTCSVHIYNNYFDGNAKYGVGMTMGGSAFVENNYFRSTSNLRPMLISGQGTDAAGAGTFSGENGGIIKAFNNVFDANKVSFITQKESSTSFDAYVVESRDEKIPESVVALKGGTSYNNFDTDTNLMYSYIPDTPQQAKENTMKYAGRVNGGDFKWSFDNNVEDQNYSVIQELKQALVNYTDEIVEVYIDNQASSPDTPVDPTPSNPTISSDIVHNFEDGITSSFFTITGNVKTYDTPVIYNGLTLKQGLKMESSTSIKFEITSAMTLVIVSDSGSKKIKIDGTNNTTDTNGILTINLASGQHEITKGDKMEVFLISLTK